MNDFQKAIELVRVFFDGNVEMALSWFITPNPLLGDVEPFDMVALDGSCPKLLRFIEHTLEENKPEESK